MSKKKMTRRALFTSVISLILCLVMLTGTTFAWFTDSVGSGENRIVAGNLDIELEYSKDMKDGSWATVEGATDLFEANTLWEPGHTEVVYLRINNAGTLALKYQLDMNFTETEGTNVFGDTFKLSQYLKYDIVDVTAAYANRDAARDAVSASAQTLASYTAKGEIEAGVPAKTIALVVYMPEEVDNNANYKTGTAAPTIDLKVVLNATQLESELDSFGPDYDAMADLGPAWDGVSKDTPKEDADGVIHITNAAELVAMMDVTGNSIYSGKTIVLDANINLGGRTVKGIGGEGTNFAGVFDGQGHTIGNFKIDASNRSYYAGLFNQVSHGGTVKNLTVRNATIKGSAMVGAVASSVDSNGTVDNCKAIDCTVIGVKKVGAVVGYSAGSTVTNNYAEDCTVYYSEKEGAEVLGFENTGSTVSNNTYSNVTVKQAAFVEVENDITTGDDFAAPNTIINLDGNTMTMTSSDQKVSGNLTVSGGTVDMTKGYFDLRPSEDAEIVFENVVFTNTEKSKTFGTVTNHVEPAMETTALVADTKMTITFRNCTFNNANVVFEAMSGYPTTIEATFENCTFNLFGGDAIEIVNYITADITVKDCTFNLTATSSIGIVDAASGSTVNVTFEGKNTLNGIAAVATTDPALVGTVDEIKVHGTPAVKVAASTWAIDNLSGVDTITVQGIATK